MSKIEEQPTFLAGPRGGRLRRPFLLFPHLHNDVVDARGRREGAPVLLQRHEGPGALLGEEAQVRLGAQHRVKGRESDETGLLGVQPRGNNEGGPVRMFSQSEPGLSFLFRLDWASQWRTVKKDDHARRGSGHAVRDSRFKAFEWDLRNPHLGADCRKPGSESSDWKLKRRCRFIANLKSSAGHMDTSLRS